MSRAEAARAAGRAGSWRTLLLGRDHPTYGAIAVVAAPDRRAAAAISVGADPESPARAGKGAPEEVPNEDAALVVDAGRRAMVAVADAHFGHRASHVLLAALADCAFIPADVAALRSIVSALPAGDAADPRSETTLAVAVLDRQAGRAFGLCFGDSTIVLLGGDADGEPLHPRDHEFVSLVRPPSNGHAFAIEDVRAGQALLAFTDGVDGCCYGHPERSLRPHHLAALARLTADPPELLRVIAERALAGVDGAPGGQDNLALAVATR